MNQNGWGLRDIVVFLIIVFLALLISMIIYNRTFKGLFTGDNKNETYNDVENDLIEIAHTYTDNYYYKVLESGDKGVVTIREMQRQHLLKTVKDIKNHHKSCSGYVYFYNEDGTTNYKTYLNCPGYQTKGYNSSYDEAVK